MEKREEAQRGPGLGRAPPSIPSRVGSPASAQRIAADWPERGRPGLGQIEAGQDLATVGVWPAVIKRLARSLLGWLGPG